MKGRIARLTVVLTYALAIFGHVMIYSASSYQAGLRGDAFYYVKKQFSGLLMGTALMIFCRHVSLDKVKKFAFPLLIISYVLLALVFVPGLGVESYGAKRWLNLGIITFQPSELMKFSLVIFLASYGEKRTVSRVKNLVVPMLAGGAACALIIVEPNMSVTVCVGIVLVVMLVLSGMKGTHLAMLAGPAVLACVLLVVSEPYRYDRLVAFLDPWANPKGEGYQLIQSYYAIAGGGLFGVGLFNSRQKFLFLPFAESDFIFSVVAEETGFFGSALLVLAFVALTFCGVYASVTAENRFDTLMCAGVSAVIGVQSLLNVAVVSGSIPPTGIPLPFISAGGTSLAVFMGATGLIVNVLTKRSVHKMVPTRHKID